MPARGVHVSVRSIESLRKRLVEEARRGLGPQEQVRPSVEKIFDGEKEAKLIAIACGRQARRAGRAGRCGFWPTAW